MIDGNELRAIARDLFPSWVQVGVEVVNEVDLLAKENAPWRKLSSTFVQSRQRQFIAGRRAAALGLRNLDVEGPWRLEIGEDQEPIWPSGICGSISHSKDWALAVVASNKNAPALGVDLEYTNRLSQKTWQMVLLPSETAWIETNISESEQQWFATLFFSLKECFYKWQFPQTRSWLGFQDAELHLDSTGTAGRAVLDLVKSPLPPLREKGGYPLAYAGKDDFLITGMWKGTA